MKKCVVAILVLAFMISLTGCTEVPKETKLAVCGSYAVPGMFCYDLKGGSFSVSVLEEDEHGRILFLYKTNNLITGDLSTAYVVCQGFDQFYVYFYEDTCYWIENDLPVDLVTLKKANDWNCPKNQNVLSKRPLHISLDLYIMTNSRRNYSEITSIISDTLDLEKSQIQNFSILDVNSIGQELFWISVETEQGIEQYYFVIDTENKVFCEKVDFSNVNQIKELREKAGWIRG